MMELTTINARIAAQVKALRAELGLSLDALSERSGVGRSTISQIERAEASPTAVVLERLATGLQVPLSRLFDAPAGEASPIARHAEQPVWQDPVSGYVRRNLSPASWPSPLRLVEVSFPAGARVAFDNDNLNHYRQQIWLLTGKMQFQVGPVLHTLAAGDCLAMALDQPVVFHNPGKVAARYLVAITHPNP